MADEFYGTEDGFEAYCEARGYTIPAGEVEPALLRSSMFIDAKYGARFTGLKTSGRDQQRSWPRNGAYDSEGWGFLSTDIPWHIEHATYEGALRELTTPGALAPDVISGKIIKSVTVEGAVSIDYAIGSADARSQVPIMTVLDGILAPLLGAATNPYAGMRSRA